MLIPLLEYTDVPIEALGTGVLLVSVLITIVWLLYLYR